MLARGELLAAERSLTELRDLRTPTAPKASALSPGPAAPASALRSAAVHAARAHRYTTGPAWYLAARIPLLGDPAASVRGVAGAAHLVTAEVLPPLVGLADGLTDDRPAGASPVDLAALRREAPSLDHAAQVASNTRKRSDGLPRSTWLPTVDRARARLTGLLDRLAPTSDEAASAARALPAMLGERDVRRYLVIFQNTAESRGTGGLPGAFAVLTATQGRLSFGNFGNDSAMSGAKATVDLGREFAADYAQNAPTLTWVNANLSPHFPYAARIWTNAWLRQTGTKVDGVIAVDPRAMAGLLAVTGPARLADGTSVTAGNVLDLTERTSYAAFDDTAERKGFFIDVAGAAAGKLLGADAQHYPALLSALRTELRQGRITAWSSHSSEQRELQRDHFAGILPQGSAPFSGLVVNNAAGTKLDYYLDRKLDWRAGQCGPGGREVTVKVTLINRAPADGLPRYVTQRVDAPDYATRPGDNRLLVSYYATTGTGLVSAALDGRTALVNTTTERGHPVFNLDVEIPRQSARSLELHLVEPPSTQPPLMLRQRLVRPFRATVRTNARCGR